MKHLLALLALVAAFGFAMPTSANADHGCYNRRIVSYLPCGRPVYASFQIIGYDRCGNPVGQWVTERPNCSCSICNPRSYQSHHHHDDCDRGRRDYSYRPSSSGLSFWFSFGR